MTVTEYMDCEQAIIRLFDLLSKNDSGRWLTTNEVHEIVGRFWTYAYLRSEMLRLTKNGKLKITKGKSANLDRFQQS